MNEQTTKLIEKLAEKFGTTAEHLWSVLVKQAQIYGIISLIGTVVVAILLGVLYRTAVKFREESDGGSIFFWWIAMVLITLFLSSNLPAIIGALINPEYWALKQVLDR